MKSRANLALRKLALAALALGLCLGFLFAFAGRTLHRQWIRVERLQMESFDQAVEDQGGGVPVEFMGRALQDPALVFIAYQGPGSQERLILPPGRAADSAAAGGGAGMRERKLADGTRVREWQGEHSSGNGRKGLLRMAFRLERREADVRAQLGAFFRPALLSALAALAFVAGAAWLLSGSPQSIPAQPEPSQADVEQRRFPREEPKKPPFRRKTR